MDRAEAGAVAGSHVLVEALYGISTSEFTELLVHVVGTGTRVVTDPDTEVLDLQGLLLVNLKETNMVARTACFGQLSHSACHLNGCKGQHVMILTTLTPMISPLAFLTLFNWLGERSEGRREGVILDTHRRKYQKRDLATTSLGAKMRIRKILGVGSCSVGKWRPTTWYSWRGICKARSERTGHPSGIMVNPSYSTAISASETAQRDSMAT